ncbi:MAG TPA: hypothetical protein ENG74_01400 [Thermoplasmatales archaeon]|nr:hypothetical protein [Thermoplasmatales archaeon]
MGETERTKPPTAQEIERIGHLITEAIIEAHERLARAIRLLETKLGGLEVELQEAERKETKIVLEIIIFRIKDKIREIKRSLPRMLKALLGNGWEVEVIHTNAMHVTSPEKILQAMHVTSPEGKVYHISTCWDKRGIAYDIQEVSSIVDVTHKLGDDERTIDFAKAKIREIVEELCDKFGPEVAVGSVVDVIVELARTDEKIRRFGEMYAKEMISKLIIATLIGIDKGVSA